MLEVILSGRMEESAEETKGRERSDAAKGLSLFRKQLAEAITANGECGGANAS